MKWQELISFHEVLLMATEICAPSAGLSEPRYCPFPD